MNRVAYLVLLLLGIFGLSGCVSVGPDYKRPSLDAPPNWTNAPGRSEAAQGLEQLAWWKSFGDPVLDSLMTQAVAANLDVAQARARVAQARAEVTIATAQTLPHLDAAGASTTNSSDMTVLASHGDTFQQSSTQTNTTYKGGFDVSWELDVFGGLRRQRESSQATQEASQEALRAVVMTLLGDVGRYYVDLREYQQRLVIARNAAQSQLQNVDVTRERFRIGLISHLDVSQAEAQLSATQAAIPTYEANARKSIHRLGVLLGQSPGSLTDTLLPVAPLPEAATAQAAGLPSELLDRRPDLRRAERQLGAASADIGVATAKQYPSFDLTMGFGVQGNTMNAFLGLANWYWSVITALAAPVFDAGKNKAGVAKKRAVYDEALAAYRAAFLAALEDVENALVTISSEKQRQQSLDTAVRANEEALAMGRERYAKGLTSFLDVISAEKSLFDAQESACSARANLLRGLISLNKALGGGWEAAGA